MPQSQSPDYVGTRASFPSTRWSNILLLKGDCQEAQAEALNSLCRTYWFPLYAFARHRNMSRHDAEDAVQSFFLSTGDADFFQQADSDRGRLRTFILTAFTRHLHNGYRHRTAQKRGGQIELLSINHDEVEEWLLLDAKSASGESEVMNFERHWATTILRTAVATLGEAAGNEPKDKERFRILSRFLNPETCHDYTIKQAASELGMSENSCFKAVQRLRQNFRLAVKEQVAATLENPTEETILNEMQTLQKALASLGVRE